MDIWLQWGDKIYVENFYRETSWKTIPFENEKRREDNVKIDLGL